MASNKTIIEVELAKEQEQTEGNRINFKCVHLWQADLVTTFFSACLHYDTSYASEREYHTITLYSVMRSMHIIYAQRDITIFTSIIAKQFCIESNSMM